MSDHSSSVGLDTGDKCMKYTILVCNAVFALTGIALVVVGTLIHIEFLDYDNYFIAEITAPPISVIIVGCVVFVVSSFGFFGAIKNNRCLLRTFAIILISLLVVQLVIGIYAIVNLDEFDQFFIDILNDRFHDNPTTYGKLETQLSCCGVEGSAIYNGTLSETCCDEVPPECTDSSETYHDRGCAYAMGTVVQENGVVIGILVLAIGVVEIVAVGMALKLAADISKIKRKRFENKNMFSST